ncbi:TRAP-type C4-dicarboxylate transport system permease small subunit [Peribacillus deserti]|uniref:TRAP-type C4-dicarboxylate transport system permease small subunit n=1 Tax=Peribacillus deserti TaxID=673318 RepID=A0ABS2QEF4_9BACI|nr:TRAP transporter small permease [Peribacillus deserti]MBM7691533.1 TRAP-type C4-dicarboxylate transport system permease small subunit [Peribacillus deserti]
MTKITKFLEQMLNTIMASALAIMVVLVFGNVVLRYFFNSGITWSEEMSRYLFVWLTFLGSIGAYQNKEHLGVDMMVKRLPRAMKKFVLLISDLIILFVLILVLDGSWKMTVMNMESVTPAVGMPLALVYGTGLVVAVSMAFITINNMYRIVFNKVTDEELNAINDSEEMIV